MEIRCPSCAQKCEVEEEPMAGQHLLCPFCGVKFNYTPQEVAIDNVRGKYAVNGEGEQKTEGSTIKITCPYCGAGYEVDASYEGEIATCGTCSKQFVMQSSRATPRKLVKAKKDVRSEEKERTLLRTSPDVRRLIPFFIFCGIIDLLMCVVAIGSPVAVAVILGGSALFFGLIYMAFKSIKYEITNKRIIAKELSSETGQRMTREVWLRDIRYVDIEEPFFFNFLGLANIRVATAGTGRIEIVLKGIKEHNEIREILDKYRCPN